MCIGLNGRLRAEHRRQPPGPCPIGDLVEHFHAPGYHQPPTALDRAHALRPIATAGTGNSLTQVPYPGPYVRPGTTPDSGFFFPGFSSVTYLDAPLWDHASHLGYSVNEINPKFAAPEPHRRTPTSTNTSPSVHRQWRQ